MAAPVDRAEAQVDPVAVLLLVAPAEVVRVAVVVLKAPALELEAVDKAPVPAVVDQVAVMAAAVCAVVRPICPR